MLCSKRGELTLTVVMMFPMMMFDAWCCFTGRGPAIYPVTSLSDKLLSQNPDQAPPCNARKHWASTWLQPFSPAQTHLNMASSSHARIAVLLIWAATNQC